MKKILLYLILALLLLTLPACAAPSQPPIPEEELAACRAAMEEIQSYDCIQIEYRTEGENGCSQCNYFRSGEDWLETGKNTNDHIINATMCCDRQYFDNFENYLDSREYDIKWNRASPVPDGAPWLYTCRWDEQAVSFVSTSYVDGGRVVTVQFDSPHIWWFMVSDSYQAEFHFDRNGKLEKVVMDAVYSREEAVRDHNGKTGEYQDVERQWKFEYTVVSTDEKKITSRIEKEYQAAQSQLAPETPKSIEALNACREIMEQLQSHDSYHISIEAEDAHGNYRDEILCSGDDWLLIRDNRGKRDASMGDMGYLSCGGRMFSTEAVGEIQNKNDLKWAAVSELPQNVVEFVPWLYSCDWDEQEVTLVSQGFVHGGAIFVMFKTPYVRPDGLHPVTKNYVVQFTLDAEHNFIEAIMRAAYRHEQPENREDDFVLAEVMKVITTDENQIAAEIDREYRRALGQTEGA